MRAGPRGHEGFACLEMRQRLRQGLEGHPLLAACRQECLYARRPREAGAVRRSEGEGHGRAAGEDERHRRGVD